MELTVDKNGTFKNKSNAVITLRGVNIVNKMFPYTAEDIGISEDDAKLIYSMGHNVVRLGICWAGVEPMPNQYNYEYIDSIIKTIRLFKKHKIYTLVDFHQDGYAIKHGGYGFPDWAALSNGFPDRIGFPAIYFAGLHVKHKGKKHIINNTIVEDFEHFWNNTEYKGRGLIDRYIDMIEEVIKKLKKEKDIVDAICGIEIINEPFPGVDWKNECLLKNVTTIWKKMKIPVPKPDGCSSDITILTKFYTKCALRLYKYKLILWLDPFNIFGLGTPSQIDFGVIARKCPEIQMVFSWHNYMNMEPDKIFSLALKQMMPYEGKVKVAHVMSEFGANREYKQWEPILQIADDLLTSWIYWTYINNPIYAFAETGGTLPPDQRLQGIVYDSRKDLSIKGNTSREVRDVLSRPYPKVTPGIPNRWTVDKDFCYDFIVNSSKNKNKLVIATPKTFFKNGYTINIYQNDNLVDMISDTINHEFIYNCAKFKTNSCIKIIINHK